jgi:acetylglutamate kinase
LPKRSFKRDSSASGIAVKVKVSALAIEALKTAAQIAIALKIERRIIFSSVCMFKIN